MKLTNPQKELLQDIAAGRNSTVEEYRPAQRLCQLGLVTGHRGKMGGYWLELTDAGRAALSEVPDNG